VSRQIENGLWDLEVLKTNCCRAGEKTILDLHWDCLSIDCTSLWRLSLLCLLRPSTPTQNPQHHLTQIPIFSTHFLHNSNAHPLIIPALPLLFRQQVFSTRDIELYGHVWEDMLYDVEPVAVLDVTFGFGCGGGGGEGLVFGVEELLEVGGVCGGGGVGGRAVRGLAESFRGLGTMALVVALVAIALFFVSNDMLETVR